MPGKVTIMAPGTVGSLNPGWSIQEDITPHVPGQPSASAGLVTFSAEAEDDSHFVMNNASSFSSVFANGTVDKGTVSGKISSVSDGPIGVGLTQTTALSQFVAERTIPAVGSGSPVGALDLAYQIVGNQRCTLTTAGGQYWSLAGHDVGFDYQNNTVLAEDKTSMGIYTGVGTFTYLSRKVVNYATASSWATLAGDIWATALTGTSPYPIAGEAHVVMFRTKLNGANMVWTLDTGYDDLNTGTGIDATVTFNYAAQTLVVAGDYNPGGIFTPFSFSSSTVSLNRDTELQIAISFGWATSTSWTLAAEVCNTSNYATVVTGNTGALSSNMDNFSRPWTATGNFRGLYQIRTTAAYTFGSLLAAYENALPYDESLTDNLLDSPIAGFVGTVWEYLNQVAAGTRVEYQIVNDRVVVRDLGASPITFDGYLGSPIRSISSQGMAQSIDAINYTTSRASNQKVYDADETDEVWTVEAGEVRTVVIQTDDTVTAAFTPQPVTTIGEYLAFGPEGSAYPGAGVVSVYMVSGANGLPIDPLEWVSSGGGVVVNSAGTNQITITFTGPTNTIPGVAGPYSFSVSDGSTNYPTLYIRGSGSMSNPVTATWPTGADPQYTTVLKAPTLDNVALGSTARLYSALSWAAAYAAGPILTLSFAMTVEQFTSLGLFSGSTFTHKNQVWRIITASISEDTVSGTATPFTTVNNLKTSWTGQTIANLITKWSGKPIDDFKIEPLAT